MMTTQFVTDAEGNRVAVILDLEMYRQLLEEAEEAAATQAYDVAKAALAEDELIPLDQAAAEL